MSTSMDKTVNWIEKWAIPFIALVAYYFFSINNIIAIYQSIHPDIDDHPVCGMPLLGCLIGQFILAGVAVGIVFVRMAIGKSFTEKHYLITGALIALPI